MVNKKDILFLDMDLTLVGCTPDDEYYLYPGAHDFVNCQRSKRELWIVTRAPEVALDRLGEVRELLQGSLDSGKLDGRFQNYIKSDGTAGLAYKDFHKINGVWFHVETGKSADDTERYSNPFIPEGVPLVKKDISLARRIVGGYAHRDIRTVMVGDFHDAGGMRSDPETPLVVVSDRVRSGEWDLVETVLDTMYHQDPTLLPFTVYDGLWSAAQRTSEAELRRHFSDQVMEVFHGPAKDVCEFASVTVGEDEYILQRFQGARIMYCPT